MAFSTLDYVQFVRSNASLLSNITINLDVIHQKVVIMRGSFSLSLFQMVNLVLVALRGQRVFAEPAQPEAVTLPLALFAEDETPRITASAYSSVFAVTLMSRTPDPAGHKSLAVATYDDSTALRQDSVRLPVTQYYNDQSYWLTPPNSKNSGSVFATGGDTQQLPWWDYSTGSTRLFVGAYGGHDSSTTALTLSLVQQVPYVSSLDDGSAELHLFYMGNAIANADTHSAVACRFDNKTQKIVAKQPVTCEVLTFDEALLPKGGYQFKTRFGTYSLEVFKLYQRPQDTFTALVAAPVVITAALMTDMNQVELSFHRRDATAQRNLTLPVMPWTNFVKLARYNQTHGLLVSRSAQYKLTFQLINMQDDSVVSLGETALLPKLLRSYFRPKYLDIAVIQSALTPLQTGDIMLSRTARSLYSETQIPVIVFRDFNFQQPLMFKPTVKDIFWSNYPPSQTKTRIFFQGGTEDKMAYNYYSLERGTWYFDPAEIQHKKDVKIGLAIGGVVLASCALFGVVGYKIRKHKRAQASKKATQQVSEMSPLLAAPKEDKVRLPVAMSADDVMPQFVPGS